MTQRQWFSFLHTYEKSGRYWEGLAKAGLIRDWTGVRLMNSSYGGDDGRFNAVAAKGGALERIIREQRRALVVDRVCGGSPYGAYDFDGELVGDYQDMLGERFLGGQIHETLTNIENDWRRILNADQSYRDKPVDTGETLRMFFDWSDNKHWLSHGALEDYAGRCWPRDLEAMWEDTRRDTAIHRERIYGRFSYCEGCHGELAWHHFYEQGAQCAMAEMGAWASKHSEQMMLAGLRGAARSAGKPWGMYFAPWGPKGCTCFIPVQENTWQCPIKGEDWTGFSIGVNYGPSSAYQRRSFFNAYLAGAWVIYDEWGAEDTLLDWDKGTLSSYGMVVKELLDFAEKHEDVGEPYVPAALVLDAKQAPPIGYEGAVLGKNARCWYESRALDRLWSQIKLGLTGMGNVYEDDGGGDWSGGNEALTLGLARQAYLFDVVPSSAEAELWQNYERIIAVGEDVKGAFTATERPTESELWAVTAKALMEVMPFYRVTQLPMQLNYRRADKAWIVGLYNPQGAVRGDVYGSGSVLNRAFDKWETLQRKAGKIGRAEILYAWPDSEVQLVDGAVRVLVPAGATVIVAMWES